MDRANATIVKHGLLWFKQNPKRQRPTLFSFPGITAQPFWTREDLLSRQRNHPSNPSQSRAKKGDLPGDWIQALEDGTPAIAAEYQQLVSKTQGTGTEDDYQRSGDEHKLHSGQWTWQSFIQKGIWQREMCEACPNTFQILQRIPGLMLDLPFSYCFFSSLKPNSTIAPHYGPMNLRIRCHLPLLLPSTVEETKGHFPVEGGSYQPQFGMRITDEVSTWHLGKACFFDDSFLHETWNVNLPPCTVHFYSHFCSILHKKEWCSCSMFGILISHSRSGLGLLTCLQRRLCQTLPESSIASGANYDPWLLFS